MDISAKMKKRKSMGPLVNRAENVMTEELGKFDVFIALVFTSNSCYKKSMAPQTSGRVQKSPEELP